MKYLKIILLTSLFVLGACKKDKENIKEVEDLSYVDKQSKGTVSFTIDGKEYTKEFKSEKRGLRALSEENFALYKAKTSDFPNEIMINFGLDLETEFNIKLYSPDKYEVGKYPVVLDYKKKSSSISYNQIGSDIRVYYTTALGNGSGGFVKITKYDYNKRIIEGEFEAKLMKRDNKDLTEVKIIKNGKFSVVFTNY